MFRIIARRILLPVLLLTLFTHPAAGTRWSIPKHICPMEAPGCFTPTPPTYSL